MKLYFDDIFVEDFCYYEYYGIIYSLENSKMGYVLVPFLEENLLKVVIEENCMISIPENIPVIKIDHITEFSFEASIPYDKSFNLETYYYMFSLLYSLYIEYDEYVNPYFTNMLGYNLNVVKNDTIFPGTLIELEKSKDTYNLKIINAEG